MFAHRFYNRCTEETNRVEMKGSQGGCELGKRIPFFAEKVVHILSDVFGTSGQAMLEALLENKRSAAEIAELGHWSLAPKIPQIIEASQPDI